jgi:hypothetical protein
MLRQMGTDNMNVSASALMLHFMFIHVQMCSDQLHYIQHSSSQFVLVDLNCNSCFGKYHSGLVMSRMTYIYI